eukprot:COSAG01_NODE_66201_length_271_cov_0.546512_1_plen_53_part_10
MDEKNFSEPTDPYINRSVSRSAFHCTFNFLQQSSFRLFIARSLRFGERMVVVR